MKTRTYLCAALLAAALTTPAAFAAHNSAHISAPPPRGITPTAVDEKDSDMMSMMRYPYRVGSSVLRTPRILGETFTGKRTFFSDRGFLQSDEPPKTHTPQDRSPRSSR
jgi:hypothetical protein